ncbi:hypothetical protein HYS95_02630 [Candidatus Daviesbacteria bacterium]|nr:hypothetical protein [Candidatus Daviesbacteria bacterium]
MLKFSTTSDITFSFADSISLQGDSGPYLQYTYARSKSVLKSARFADKEINTAPLEKEERELLRSIEYFEDLVNEAALSYSPNIIAQYLTNLARQFNLFYQKHRIINAEGDKKEMRLALTAAVASILKQGLYLLGIEAPERM